MKWKFEKMWKIVVIMCLGVVVCIGTALAGSTPYENGFRFSFSSVDDANNSSAQTKTKGTPYAGVYVLYAQNSRLDSVGEEIGAYSSGYPTNFIVIAADDQQITNNIIIYAAETGLLKYYSNQHEGAVRLRANSGSTLVGYHIGGTWDPNNNKTN